MKTELTEIEKLVKDGVLISERKISLSDKISAMEKAIKMSKDVHDGDKIAGANYAGPFRKATTEEIIETAKTIYDWLTA